MKLMSNSSVRGKVFEREECHVLSFFFLFSLNSHDSKKEKSKNAFLEQKFSCFIVRISLIVASYRQKIFDRHELSSEYLYRQKIFDRHELS